MTGIAGLGHPGPPGQRDLGVVAVTVTSAMRAAALAARRGVTTLTVGEAVVDAGVVAEPSHHERFQLRVAGAVGSDHPKPVKFLISGGCIRRR
jgi:hypothetical protein